MYENEYEEDLNKFDYSEAGLAYVVNQDGTVNLVRVNL